MKSKRRIRYFSVLSCSFLYSICSLVKFMWGCCTTQLVNKILSKGKETVLFQMYLYQKHNENTVYKVKESSVVIVTLQQSSELVGLWPRLVSVPFDIISFSVHNHHVLSVLRMKCKLVPAWCISAQSRHLSLLGSNNRCDFSFKHVGKKHNEKSTFFFATETKPKPCSN